MKSLIRSTWLTLFLAGVCSQLSAATAPGAPASVSASAGNAQATVTFTAPASNGAAITNYTVTSSPGGFTATGASSPLTVTGLTNGTSYTFTVTATNSVGTGAASSASAAAMTGDWATNFGLSGSDVVINSTTTDAAGNVYVTGYFNGVTLAVGGVTLTRIGNNDAFAVKYNAAGTVVWAKNFGGIGAYAYGQGIAVDGSGNVYLGGSFNASLTTPALTKIGWIDAFALKLDATGATTWSKHFGGTGASTYGIGIAVDGSGNVYLGGYFSDASLTTPALTKIGNYDAFALKLDATGATTWAKNFGGTGAFVQGQGIAVDGSGNVYLGGYFDSASLTTPALTKIGTRDAFALKLDAAGATTWSKNFGGTGANALGQGIAVDGSGNVYLGGYFNTASLTTPGLTKIGTRDAFALKLDATGATTWSKNFGGTGASTYGIGIAVDGSGNVYLGGYFKTASLTTPGLTIIGTSDAFALKLDAAGATTWSKNFSGTSASTYGIGIAVDGSGNVYLGAYFADASLTTPALTKIGRQDALLIKQSYPFSAAPSAPGAPTSVSASAGNGQARVTFTAPASNGGASITGYTVTATPVGGGTAVTGSGASSPITVTGLTNGVSYTFTVSATNDVGTGAASSATSAVTPATVPGAPTGVTVTGGNGQASVGFTPPADTGGAAILGSNGYTVTATPVGGGTPITASGNASPIAVTGLLDGTVYTFTVTANNSLGAGPPSAPSAPQTVTPPTRLSNLSVRIGAGTGDRTLIVGFVVGGAGTSGAKPLLVRGVGPTLASYGVTGTLADPSLALIPQGASTALATNDNWAGDAQLISVGNAVGAFPLSSAASKDAAFYLTPASGVYTVQVTGTGGTTGIALAEIYDASGTSYNITTPRLINLSARAQVGTGEGVLIAGFVIDGTASRTVLIRAVGPTLATYGVGGVLADPQLELTQAINGSNVVVATNDNWGGDAQITSVASTVGAFALGSAASKDAAILVTLPPGIYTAKASGAAGSTGVALIEVYEVP